MNPLPSDRSTPSGAVQATTSTRKPRLCKVLIHRTPDKELMYVVRTVMELTRFCKEEATHRMWESYHSGQSQILETHFERAELYVEQFMERGIKASLEPIV